MNTLGIHVDNFNNFETSHFFGWLIKSFRVFFRKFHKTQHLKLVGVMSHRQNLSKKFRDKY